MKNPSSRRSNLLLVEIILSVLFFSFSSAVCLQMFVRASLLERQTEELDMAVRYVSSAAELFSHPEHAMEHIRTLYPDALIEGPDACVWFDEDYRACSKEEASYQMKIASYSQDARTTVWSVGLYHIATGKEIYQLESSTYLQYIPAEEP